MIPLPVYLPELILIIAAGVLMLMGISKGSGTRRIAPVIALLTLVLVFFYQLPGGRDAVGNPRLADPTGMFRIDDLALYIKMIAAGVGVLFVLLSWPNNRQSTANPALSIGEDVCEFFALMLVSISGIFLVAGANDIILLFLGIELASIPTYIMVSISRPLPVAQEAGVKYFFLGAMSAALMLFGFSYLYGTTGSTNISQIAAHFAGEVSNSATHPVVMLSPWEMLAATMIILGFAFKLAAVPLHFYAADVYQGAATPVTALLSFVPKTSGMVALIKILFAFGAGAFLLPPPVVKLLWIIAVLTMTFGNVLGLLQTNVKRVLAYSSVAHSGYMLTGITALIAAAGSEEVRRSIQQHALAGVIFYLAAYGIMSAGSFGVLMLLPAKPPRRFGDASALRPTPSSPDLPPACAETYEDIAGVGRVHVMLGLMMAVSCFSLIGLPLTVGFFAKFYLISPALQGHNYWLVVFLVINAAIAAAYYLKIVATMFLRVDTDPNAGMTAAPVDIHHLSPFFSFPAYTAVALSTMATLFFGIFLPATQQLSARAEIAATPALPTLNATDATSETSASPLDKNTVASFVK